MAEEGEGGNADIYHLPASPCVHPDSLQSRGHSAEAREGGTQRHGLPGWEEVKLGAEGGL